MSGAGIMPRPFIHSATVLCGVSAANRLPATQAADGASACKFISLEPIPLEWEVQKGIIFLPEKS